MTNRSVECRNSSVLIATQRVEVVNEAPRLHVNGLFVLACDGSLVNFIAHGLPVIIYGNPTDVVVGVLELVGIPDPVSLDALEL